MPTVYEDPAVFNLELVGELREFRVHEDVYCRNWHIAVWRNTISGNLWYNIESRWGTNFNDSPFADVDEIRQLQPLSAPSDFDRFKRDLNDYWRGRLHHLQADERWMRNRRNRLQRRVGRILFS